VEWFFDNNWPWQNNGLGIDTWYLLPYSRGFVHSVSSDPFDAPDLNVRYMTVPIDMDIQIQGLRGARKIFQTEPLKSLLVQEENIPGDKVPDNADGGAYQDWLAWMKSTGNSGPNPQHSESVHHPIGTCSMTLQEHGGVVSSDFKVIKLKTCESSMLQCCRCLFPLTCNQHFME